MDGIVTLLFNPVAIFGVVFFGFGIKNLITRQFPSAVVYLLLSLAITLGGAWLGAKVATSHGPTPIPEQPTKDGSSSPLTPPAAGPPGSG